MAGNPNKKYCVGCIYWKRIACTQIEYCNYMEETGRSRMLICPPGKDCTVRREGEKKPPKRVLQHKYDFTPSPKKPRNVLDQGRAAALYALGGKDGEIAKVLSVAVSTICAWRKRTGRAANAARGRPKKEIQNVG